MEGSSQSKKQSGKTTSKRNISYYTVKKGDTLSTIAKKHGVGTEELRKANRIKGSALANGQRLLIP